MSESLSNRVREQVAIEQHFWQTDPHERPEIDSLANFVNKAPDAAIFYGLVQPWLSRLPDDATVVEVGGGQGWASCILKRLRPKAQVTLTDAVEEAVRGAWIWQRVFDCQLDRAVASAAQRIPAEDASVDFIFCFAAAHHFIDHAAALRETRRVLKPSGTCVWFYEPTAPTWIHKAAEARVNRKRPEVPEHVLIPSQISRIAADVGLVCRTEYSTSIAHRGRGATLYYTMLGVLTPLQRILPCTAHFEFTLAR